jgi:prenyl protein peptidase
VFKLAYTQIFGIYSGFVYIKTGSLWPAFALHAQCNYFGFPSFDQLMNNEHRRSLRIVVACLYLGGIFAFFNGFGWCFDGHSPWFKDPQQLSA